MGVAGGLLVKTVDQKVQDSSPTCSRDLFLFWVHSTLKLSRRFFLTSVMGKLSHGSRGIP